VLEFKTVTAFNLLVPKLTDLIKDYSPFYKLALPLAAERVANVPAITGLAIVTNYQFYETVVSNKMLVLTSSTLV
jgi:hypothetical protein